MSAMNVGGISGEQWELGRSLPFAVPHSQARPALARTCRIAIAGFGTVGKAVARLLSSWQQQHQLQLTHVFNRNIARKQEGWVAGNVHWTDDMQQVLSSEADVVIEVMGGLEPAGELVRCALQSGKSVVTANKQLIARHGAELLRFASDRGQYLGFGACVAGGIPVLSALQDGLGGDRLVQIRGILNGTCNYILTRIEAGASYEQALLEAQQAGFAEADPSSDVDGQDAAAKLAILAQVGLKISAATEQVACRSIRSVRSIDFDYASDLRCTIRQISTARLIDDDAALAVGPALVSRELSFAKITGSQNLVVSSGEYGGETAFGGHGAGGDPTAVAVVSDVLQAARHRAHGGPGVVCPPTRHCSITRDLDARQYLRFVVRDRPGIIAAIAAVLASHDLNLDAVLQKPGHDKSALPFVITLERCRQTRLDAALEQVAKFDFLAEAPLAMPILD